MNSTPATPDRPRVLSVKNLSVEFRTPNGALRAVDDISFSVPRGSRVGIVGESGCGKSVTALAIMRLLNFRTAKIAHGTIKLNDVDLVQIPENQMKALRGDRLSMIFQEPMSALNPLMRIGDQISEVLSRKLSITRRSARQACIEALQRVGMPAPERRVMDYPHQLSGGMRQRAMIAMAIAAKPDLLLADEPTTALDVTIQAQIIDLLHELQQDIQTSVVLITHDIGLVAEFCESVVVMYAGRVVEQADVQTLFSAPKHPYTIGLMAAVPKLYERSKLGYRRRLQEIPGTVPNLLDLKPGCRFADRCHLAEAICREHEPELVTQADGSFVRCHFPRLGEVS